MGDKKQNVIFFFRRDLRVNDNMAFAEAVKYCKQNEYILVPMFIFTKAQIDKNSNKYHSQYCVNFMLKCLEELQKDLRGALQFYEADKDTDIVSQYDNVQAIFYNKDYTPYAKMRDECIDSYCQKHSIASFSYEDYTLFKMNTIMTDQGNPYTVYTPFYNKSIELKHLLQKKYKLSKTYANVFSKDSSLKSKTITDMKKKYYDDAFVVPNAGRKAALKRLNRRTKFDYAVTRDDPSIDGTTKLSPYMKFGCISVREIFTKVSKKYGYEHQLVKELLWREFYAHLTFHNPHILAGQINANNEAFQKKYIKKVIWKDHPNEEWLEKWKEGNTGFPFVDAGMRQMKATGWMHNRLRMVVAMFFVKDMMMDWRIGEQYFAQSLVDYDPASNNGGWQWSSSTGSDAAPYFRIFNPWTQSQRFDKDCVYIRKWIPELKSVSNKDIHEWYKKHGDDKYLNVKYGKPMLEHSDSVKKIKEMFKKIV